MQKTLMALLFLLMTLPAEAGEGNPPPVSEYDRVPAGILLGPQQRETPAAATDTATDQGVDPQVLTHSVTDLTAPVTTADHEAPKIQTLNQVEAAYAAGRYTEVITPLEMLVAQNDTRAALMLGVMLDTGQGVEANPERAATLMTQAAEGGIALAQHRLAIMHYQGRGVAKDPMRAMMWLHIAIAKYPPGAERDRAMADRSNLDAALSRRDRETSLFMAREWLSKRDEAHLLDATP